MDTKELQDNLHKYRVEVEDTGILNTGAYPLYIVRTVVDRGLFQSDPYDLICPPELIDSIKSGLRYGGINEYLIKTVQMTNPALGLPRFGILEIEESAPVSYIYEGLVTSIYDADTVTFNFRLGFGGERLRQKLRLFEINAKEVRGDTRDEGIKSRDYLRDLLEGKEVFIKTHKKGTAIDGVGKYGRWLVSLYIKYGGKLINVNEHLVEAGLAQTRIY